MLKNKKRWIILILTLILLILFSITKKELAITFPNSCTFPNFSTNENLYCGNRGWSFSRNAMYNLTYGPFTVNGTTISPTPNIPSTYDSVHKLNDQLYWMKLSYILSEMSNDTDYVKPSVGRSKYQVAIWILLGTNVTHLSPVCTDYIDTAEILLAQANAYYNFRNNYGSKPVISFGENFGLQVSGSNNYIGPFKINYKTAAGSATISGTPSYATYGNLTAIYLDGQSTSNIFEKTDSGFTKLYRFPNSDEEFYIKITNTNEINHTIKVRQNSATRTAEFAIYHSENKTQGYSYEFIRNNERGIVTLDVNGAFCINCMEELESLTPGVCYICGQGPAEGSILELEEGNLVNCTKGHTFCYITAKGYVCKNHSGYDLIIRPVRNLGGTAYYGDRDLGVINTTDLIKQDGTMNFQNLIMGEGDRNYVYSELVNFSLLPQLKLNLKKQNTAGQDLAGAQYTITAVQDSTTIYSNENVVIPADISITPRSINNITVTIEETTAPTWHIEIAKPITITYTYNQTTRVWEISNIDGWTANNGIYINGNDKIKIEMGTATSSESLYTITIYNRPKADVNLKKIDKISGQGISGVLFNIKIQNCAGGPSNITGAEDLSDFDFSTPNNGIIPLKDLEFILNADNSYKPITITFTEISVPTNNDGLATYRLLHGPITITLTYTVVDGVGTIVATLTASDLDVVELTEETLEITAKNEPLIHLGGKVWLDVQQGTKPVEAPNGLLNTNEEGIGGIPLYLFKTEDNGNTYLPVNISTYNELLMTETMSEEGTISYITGTMVEDTTNTGRETTLKPKEEEIFLGIGQYFFPNLPKLENGYYVIFYSYDGVNYISTIIPEENQDTANKASESAVNYIENQSIRNAFNARLQTINKDTKITTYLNLITTVTTGRSNIGKVVSANFTDSKQLEYDTYESGNKYTSILKTTNDYNTTTHENGKTVLDEYKIYSRTIDGHNETNLNINFGLKERELDLSLISDVYEAEVNINEKSTIYKYNDLLGSITLPAEEIGEEISYSTIDKYKLKLYESDYKFNNGNSAGSDYGSNDENLLNIYITYAILLNNQSSETASINKIVNYYNPNYTFDSATYGDIDITRNVETKDNINIAIENEVREYKTLEVSGLESHSLQEGGRNTLYLKFKVNGTGNAINLGEYDNITEIIEYSSGNGLVDQDSAPGNALKEITDKKVYNLQFEDDTDRARGIEITVPETRVRTITGNVWEDLKTEVNGEYKYGNGTKDGNETLLAGIRVDLIRNETSIQNTTTNADGTYSFTGFIPGDYIVRFTYDGTVKNNEGIFYNAQNYKSTTVSEKNYNNALLEGYYNTIYGTDGENTSKATDNAIKRINQIISSIEINSETGKQIATNELNSAMEANTQKIYVSVDTDSFEDVDGQTEVADGNNPKNIGIKGVNFGLERRPKTKITIEEHIRRISLIDQDKIALLQAEINEDKNLFEGGIVLWDYLEGLKNGLKAIKTTRESFGSWSIETDIGEVLQGAELEVEYIYKIKNEGDIDYLSTGAIGAYETGKDEYISYLERMQRFNMRGAIMALGKTYFTGIIDNTVAKVPTTVQEIKDYDNYFELQSGDLEATDGGNFKFKQTDGTIIEEKVKTVLLSKGGTGALLPGEEHDYKVVLKRGGLSPTGKLDFENYISQIMSYTNAAGRKDEGAIPGNLEERYIYSYDQDVTLNANEEDEFAAEKIIITPPTGENKQNPIIIGILIITGIAIIGIGIIGIKKYVIK